MALIKQFTYVFLSVIFSASLVSSKSLAIFSKEKPIHHQFNAHLLVPEERQVSIYGNIKLGITDNLELGTQGLFLLLGIPNLSIKHKMFAFDHSHTSFSSHTFAFAKNNSKSIYSMQGVVNSYTLQENLNLNSGLFTHFLWTDGDNIDRGESHIITPLVGIDYLLNESFGFSSFMFIPMWGSIELNTDIGDVEGQFHFYRGSKLGDIYPLFLFASITHSWDSFNLEFGLWSLGFKTTTPYINMFWRY